MEGGGGGLSPPAPCDALSSPGPPRRGAEHPRGRRPRPAAGAAPAGPGWVFQARSSRRFLGGVRRAGLTCSTAVPTASPPCPSRPLNLRGGEENEEASPELGRSCWRADADPCLPSACPCVPAPCIPRVTQSEAESQGCALSCGPGAPLCPLPKPPHSQLLPEPPSSWSIHRGPSLLEPGLPTFTADVAGVPLARASLQLGLKENLRLFGSVPCSCLLDCPEQRAGGADRPWVRWISSVNAVIWTPQ
ncbi:voltage-dependent calcium channel gamma-5 subunit isoform X2 [Larus michahellis]|uniref:voltage-dependent calcium channel gamma-5 subunit isoform X2 n=1 Tax=Larus michahellis TaxID=119627 RepID=UPI003D9B7BD4